MSNTPRFGLPLLGAAQAQKHVTINEGLTRTDALASARVESRDIVVPPPLPKDGEAYIVGPAATGDWFGQDDDLALFLNGGWDFVKPWSGCVVWVEAERTQLTYDDGHWVAGRSGGGAGGAVTLTRIAEVDHTLAANTVSQTPMIIPDKALVIGVTARVIEGVTGAGTWSLGVPGAPDRYGSGYGGALNSFAHGMTGQPQAYFDATPLEITSDGAAFSAGRIRIAVHYLELTPPFAV